MAVSNQEKIEIAMETLGDLVVKLVTEHGNTQEYWLRLLQGTRLYHNMLNPKTGLWGEGVMYLYGALMQEIRNGQVK